MTRLHFHPLTLDGALAVLPLREKFRAALRTGRAISKEDQEQWYYTTTDKHANQYWWEISRITEDDGSLEMFQRVGYCGIEHIDWLVRSGEMSLLIDGDDGEWAEAFDHLLNRAFNDVGLREVHAEVYHCSPDRARWRDAANTFRVLPIVLPMRKFHDGVVWDADYLSWRLPS